jgi:hypothetical protein
MKLFFIFLFFSAVSLAQHKGAYASAGDGIALTGYVDRGAFMNFTGPNIHYKNKDSKYMLGMLPSLRFKEDKGATTNSFITPNLGIGLTYTYRYFALQVPFYYTAKTASKNGRWLAGIGVGVNIEYFSKAKNNSQE